MKALYKNKDIHTESGLTLMEVLLAVGVISVLILGAFQVTQDWAEQIVNRQEAAYFSKVHNAAVAYVQTNFARIWSSPDGFNEPIDLTDIDGDDDIDNDDIASLFDSVAITIADEGSFYLIEDGNNDAAVLPANFSEISPARRRVRIYARNVGLVGGQRTLEVYTLMYAEDIAAEGQRPLGLDRLKDIVQVLGPDSAILEDDGDLFRSSFGAWELDVDEFGAGKVTPAALIYSPATIDLSSRIIHGYIGLRGVVNFEDSLETDFLYRIAIDGGGAAINSMEANLDMAGNPIRNINTVTADNVVVGQNLNLAIDAAGAPTGPSAFFTDEVFFVEGDAHVLASANAGPGSINCDILGPPGARVLNPAAAGVCNVAGGNFIVSGVATNADSPNALNTTESLVVQGNLDASGGQVSAGRIRAQTDLNIGRSLLVADTTTTAGTITTGNLAAIDLTVTGTVTTDHLQLSRLSPGSVDSLTTGSLNAASLNSDSFSNIGSLRVTQDIGVRSATFSSGLSANQMFIGNLRNCTANFEHVFPYRQDNFQPVATPYDCTGDGPN